MDREHGAVVAEAAEVDGGVVAGDEGGEVIDHRVGDRDRVRSEEGIAVVPVLGTGGDEEGDRCGPVAHAGAGERGEADELVAVPHRDDVHAARAFEVAVPGEDVCR